MIYLLRHPRPAIEEGICFGALDLELAEPVEPLIAKLRPLLPERYTLYSSPLKRALAVAEHFGEPIIEPRLREMDFGEWEGQDYASIAASYAEWALDIYGFRPPGGESAAEMAARACAFIREARCPRPYLIVAHAGPIRAIIADQLGLRPEDALRFRVDFGSLSAVHEGELVFLNHIPR